jgi:hypothetical protein
LMESSAQKWLYGHRRMDLTILYFKFQAQNCHEIFNPPENTKSISLRSTYVRPSYRKCISFIRDNNFTKNSQHLQGGLTWILRSVSQRSIVFKFYCSCRLAYSTRDFNALWPGFEDPFVCLSLAATSTPRVIGTYRYPTAKISLTVARKTNYLNDR